MLFFRDTGPPHFRHSALLSLKRTCTPDMLATKAGLCSSFGVLREEEEGLCVGRGRRERGEGGGEEEGGR